QHRLAVLDGLAHLHRVGNDLVRDEVINQTRRLIEDDSRAVSAAAMKLITTLEPEGGRREREEHTRREAEKPRWTPTSPHPRADEQHKSQVVTSPPLSTAVHDVTTTS